MRRSTVLSLSLRQGFPGWSNRYISPSDNENKALWERLENVRLFSKKPIRILSQLNRNSWVSIDLSSILLLKQQFDECWTFSNKLVSNNYKKGWFEFQLLSVRQTFSNRNVRQEEHMALKPSIQPKLQLNSKTSHSLSLSLSQTHTHPLSLIHSYTHSLSQSPIRK